MKKLFLVASLALGLTALPSFAQGRGGMHGGAMRGGMRGGMGPMGGGLSAPANRGRHLGWDARPARPSNKHAHRQQDRKLGARGRNRAGRPTVPPPPWQ